MSHRCGTFCPCGGMYQQHEILTSYAATTSSVDCTLSLGTPSTRRVSDENVVKEKKRGGICSASGFGWNITSSSKSTTAPPTAGAAAGDPLLARRCANCDTTSTPLWRNGPKGPKSLCNACGIRYKKEERRATASTAVETQQMMWGQGQQQRLGSTYDDDSSSGGGSSYLSWRFSIADRPGFVHDFGGF